MQKKERPTDTLREEMECPNRAVGLRKRTLSPQSGLTLFRVIKDSDYLKDRPETLRKLSDGLGPRDERS
jgi:hypothetical protein